MYSHTSACLQIQGNVPRFREFNVSLGTREKLKESREFLDLPALTSILDSFSNNIVKPYGLQFIISCGHCDNSGYNDVDALLMTKKSILSDCVRSDMCKGYSITYI